MHLPEWWWPIPASTAAGCLKPTWVTRISSSFLRFFAHSLWILALGITYVLKWTIAIPGRKEPCKNWPAGPNSSALPSSHFIDKVLGRPSANSGLQHLCWSYWEMTWRLDGHEKSWKLESILLPSSYRVSSCGSSQETQLRGSLQMKWEPSVHRASSIGFTFRQSLGCLPAQTISAVFLPKSANKFGSCKHPRSAMWHSAVAIYHNITPITYSDSQ